MLVTLIASQLLIICQMSKRVHYNGPDTTKLCGFNKENIVLTVSATKETNEISNNTSTSKHT